MPFVEGRVVGVPVIGKVMEVHLQMITGMQIPGMDIVPYMAVVSMV
jgi:hypothetical protein